MTTTPAPTPNHAPTPPPATPSPASTIVTNKGKDGTGSPPRKPPTQGAIDIYWGKLQNLLQQTSKSLCILRPKALSAVASSSSLPASGDIASIEVRSHAAALFQGLTREQVLRQVDSADAGASILRPIVDNESAGRFVNYGLAEENAAWVATNIARDTEDDKHLVVFEAEIACLPVTLGEDMLRNRKRMLKFKGAIDTCTRILVSMSGRTRKKTSSSALDKLKITLEKAELTIARELDHISRSAAVGDAEPAPDARKKAASSNSDKQTATPSKQRKADASVQDTPTKSKKFLVSEEKKRKLKAQQNAQASFMMRFVRPKSLNFGDAGSDSKNSANSNGPSSNAGDPKHTSNGQLTDLEEEEKEAKELEKRREQGLIVAPLLQDLDNMSASRWLRSFMPSVGPRVIHAACNLQSVDPSGTSSPLPDLAPVSDTTPITDFKQLKLHLSEVASRRRVGELSIKKPMLKFRKSRREHVGDPNPRFIQRRRQCRGGDLGIKLLQFAENTRPAYFGTWNRTSKIVGRKRPFKKDTALIDYDVDSEEEWDEDEDGEDLELGDEERDEENEELQRLYGKAESDEEDDDDFFDDGDMEKDEEDDVGEDEEDDLSVADDDDGDENDENTMSDCGDKTEKSAAKSAAEKTLKVDEQVTKTAETDATKSNGSGDAMKEDSVEKGDSLKAVNGSKSSSAIDAVPIDVDDDEISIVPDLNRTSKDSKNSKLVPVSSDAKQGSVSKKALKRRKAMKRSSARNNILIYGPYPCVFDKAGDDAAKEDSGLSKYKVDTYGVATDQVDIPMFNPMVLDMCSFAAEHSNMNKSGTSSGAAQNGGHSSTTPKSNKGKRANAVHMDDKMKSDLMDCIKRGGPYAWTRDRIVEEFRNVVDKGECVAKSELVRVIGEIATFEKRENNRATWHLKVQ